MLILAALVIAAVVATVVLSVLWVKEDDPVRGNDVEFLVEHFD